MHFYDSVVLAGANPSSYKFKCCEALMCLWARHGRMNRNENVPGRSLGLQGAYGEEAVQTRAWAHFLIIHWGFKDPFSNSLGERNDGNSVSICFYSMKLIRTFGMLFLAQSFRKALNKWNQQLFSETKPKTDQKWTLSRRFRTMTLLGRLGIRNG